MRLLALAMSLPFLLNSLAAFAQPTPYRVDCRYHNDEGRAGVKFCYASALYDVDPATQQITAIHLGIGCDYQTLFNDSGKFDPQETIGDRLSPTTASIPAIELTPEGALRIQGTYSSVLDVSYGRMAGTCYVQPNEGPVRQSQTE